MGGIERWTSALVAFVLRLPVRKSNFDGDLVLGCVYIGKGTNDQHYKIGRTGEVQGTRKKQHRTANPSFEYHLVIETEFSSEIESRLHSHFGSKRVEGTKEWFKLTVSDLDKIKIFLTAMRMNSYLYRSKSRKFLTL